ncbi:MAG: PSD1 and planctomycete cytochrome C domain-containing protein [Rubripirellula sp.]|nr:PSD1 and planctomycete cytochrome C domain-containing protein [Rubripirellula sp.]
MSSPPTPMRVLVQISAVLLLLVPVATHAADKIDFNRDIKPILSDHCYACHGPDADQRQGGGADGLRLDTKQGAFADLGGAFAIVPGDLEASELIQRISSADEDEVMPPGDHPKQLSPEHVQLLVRWVQQGAVWSQHWAYSPLQPRDRNGNWIDLEIRSKLADQGLQPSAPADPRILVRRAYFDIIGLPPSPAEVDEFLNDQSGHAWENMIDRLLASPHFGERMAIYWLDLVRYADTVGYHGDQDVSVSPYRDYVIDAFNSNLPFDQFTREQLAGDLYPEPTQQQLIASGYNKLGMMSAEGGAQPKEYLAKYASDRVRTASTVWLGSTLGCAECHDHKFDPFTQKDFYQFASFFADIKERGLYSGANSNGNWGPTVRVPDQELSDLLAPVQDLIGTLTNEYETTDLTESMDQWATKLRRGDNSWQVLTPVEATALHGTQLEVLEDGSLLASGPTGGTNTYTIKATVPIAGLRGFRVEVLPHESLPKRGPGRAGNGNFVLSEFEVAVVDAEGVLKPLPFASAKASFEQEDSSKANPFKGWKAIAAIDGDAKGETWGWAVMPELGKVNDWVGELKVASAAAEGTELVITIKQNHTNPDHTLGHFRLFATTADVQLDPRLSLPAEIKTVVELEPEQRDEKQAKQLLDYYRTIAPELATVRQGLEEAKQKKTKLENDHTRLTLVTQSVEPREMRVLPRGNWMDKSGEVVTPNVPHFLPPMILGEQRRANRLDLAKWLTSRENPLTARVMVNRFWKLFFGAGLAKVLDDIGSQGEFPSHPELLDLMALEFVESGWNVKHVLKLIAMSDTYRQASVAPLELVEVDPYNRLLARQSRFRIDAEMVRDNALTVSGLLVRELGGRSVKPYQPVGLLRHLNFPRRTYKHDEGADQYRRGVYTHWQRQFLHPAMKLFDAPAREECTAERTRSNTPLAALLMLNDPSYIEAARVFAERILKSDAADDSQRIKSIFESALSRTPSEEETQVLVQLIESQRQRFTADPDAAKSLTSVGDRAPDSDLNLVEVAALLSATRTVFNMHEFITRN